MPQCRADWVCANRILVQDGVYDTFTKCLAETARAMKVADGFEPGAVIGPLIDMKAVEKVEAHIADAVKKGAKVVLGGKRAAQGGSFFEPTVLTDVTTDMIVTKEETFGPVAPLYRFKTDAEAIKMANDTEFGLAAYSRDIGRIWRRGARIRHRRHQRGHHLDRDRAVWRDEGKRHRPVVWHARVMRDRESLSTTLPLVFRLSRELRAGAKSVSGLRRTLKKSAVKKSAVSTAVHKHEWTSGFQQGRCGRRSPRDAANLENEDACARDFDCDRKDREQSLRGQFCARQPKRSEQCIADHRYNERARRCSAEPSETTKPLTISGMELCGNTTAADVRPTSNPADDRKPERVTVNRAHDPADRPYIVTDRTLHHGIPRDAGLHGDENTGDHQNDGVAYTPCPFRK